MTRTGPARTVFLLRTGFLPAPNAGEVGWVRVAEIGRLPKNVWDE